MHIHVVTSSHWFMTRRGWRRSMAIVSVSLPDELAAAVDLAVTAGGHRGRSELVRAAVRAYLQERVELPARHGHGSITVVYPHGHEARVSEVRHAFHDVVLSLMHTHCEPEVCMDVLLVGGDGARIRDLYETLRRMREIQQAILVPVAT
jgi:CopG family nickel-responsive transcriptional regulator